MKVLVCYDKLGDVTFNRCVLVDGDLELLKKHECVFMIVDVETGEILKDCDDVRVFDIKVPMVDVRDILELRWYTIEELSKREEA
jgi:hypothetical protein